MEQGVKPARRGYSREFALAPGDEGKRIGIDRVPSDLLARVQARCRRDGVSVRAVVLGHLVRWVEAGNTETAKAGPAAKLRVSVDGVAVEPGSRDVRIEIVRE